MEIKYELVGDEPLVCVEITPEAMGSFMYKGLKTEVIEGIPKSMEFHGFFFERIECKFMIYYRNKRTYKEGCSAIKFSPTFKNLR